MKITVLSAVAGFDRCVRGGSWFSGRWGPNLIDRAINADSHYLTDRDHNVNGIRLVVEVR